MIYVFDTSSLRELQHFYPSIFQSIWPRLDALVNSGELVSTREVYNELQIQRVSPDVLTWCNSHRHIFAVPTSDEQNFMSTIFGLSHFRALVPPTAALRGTPVADPFVIARLCRHRYRCYSREAETECSQDTQRVPAFRNFVLGPGGLYGGVGLDILMAVPKQKLELTWIGKQNRPRLEPRILLENPALSCHAEQRVTEMV